MRARPSLVKSAAVAMAFTFGLLAWAAAAPRAGLPPVVRSPAAPVARRSAAGGGRAETRRHRRRRRCRLCERARPSDRPDSCQYDDTADLLDGLTAVLVLGDGQYETGDYDAYVKYYGPTWGRFRTRTFPAPGNHEYTEDPSPSRTATSGTSGTGCGDPTGSATTASTSLRDAHRVAACAGTSSRCPRSSASRAADAGRP